MKIEIMKGKSGKFYWRIKAKNGEILAHSQSYSTKQKAQQTARSVKRFFKNAQTEG